MTVDDCGRVRGPWPSLAAVLVALSCLLTACGGNSGSETDSAPPHPSPTTTPNSPVSPSETKPSTRAPDPHATASATPGCLAGSTTITHGPEDPATRTLCVRSGTTLTVILNPRPQGAWPQPRSSNPMLALVTSTAVDDSGGSRVTVRAARIGSATVTWGPRSAPLFTLRLSVAAYPVQ